MYHLFLRGRIFFCQTNDQDESHALVDVYSFRYRPEIETEFAAYDMDAPDAIEVHVECRYEYSGEDAYFTIARTINEMLANKENTHE